MKIWISKLVSGTETRPSVINVISSDEGDLRTNQFFEETFKKMSSSELELIRNICAENTDFGKVCFSKGKMEDISCSKSDLGKSGSKNDLESPSCSEGGFRKASFSENNCSVNDFGKAQSKFRDETKNTREIAAEEIVCSIQEPYKIGITSVYWESLIEFRRLIFCLMQFIYYDVLRMIILTINMFLISHSAYFCLPIQRYTTKQGRNLINVTASTDLRI